MEKMVFQRVLLSGGLLSSELICALSIGFVFRPRTLKPAIMAVRALEVAPSTTTCWFLDDRNHCIHLKAVPWNSIMADIDQQALMRNAIESFQEI